MIYVNSLPLLLTKVNQFFPHPLALRLSYKGTINMINQTPYGGQFCSSYRYRHIDNEGQVTTLGKKYFTGMRHLK